MATPHDVRYRVLRLMKVHDRSKLERVDDVLKANAGKEEELIRKCVTKYGPEPAPEPFQERLERYFRAQQPSRLSEVKSLVQSFQGKEFELMSSLVAQHGEEPDPPTPRQSAPQAESAVALQRERLTRFYQHYAPDKGSGEIEKAIEKYAATGEFDKMWVILEKKYGPESSIPSKVPPTSHTDVNVEQKRRLLRFYQHYAPDKGEAEVEKAIEKYSASGEFDKMWSILEKKYGPESAIPSQEVRSVGSHNDQRTRLQAFYRHYCPDKGDSDIDKAIEKYGTTGEFDKMWAILEKKYGPESAVHNRSIGASNPVDEQRKRLLRFYQHYAPEKGEEDVSKAIEKYSVNGDFDKMWMILEKKYGPESALSSGNALALTSPPNVGNQKDRLRRFYARYAPDKSESDIVSAVEKYSKAPGGFEQMWTTLEKKYGPEEPSRAGGSSNPSNSSTSKPVEQFEPSENLGWLTPDLRQHYIRLQKFYAHYVPEKSENEILRALYRYTKTVGGVNSMWEQLQKKYGPEPKDASSELSVRDRLKKFFAHYAPGKTDAEIDASVKKYGATPQGYEEMWSTLERRYGPEDFTNPAAKPRSIQISHPTFNVTALLPPTAAVDDDPKPLNLRKAVEARTGGTSRQIGGRSAVVGFSFAILHVSIRLFGADLALYERAPPEKRSKFRDAIEIDVAVSCNIQQRHVRTVRLTAAAGIVCEVDIELGAAMEAEDVSDTLLQRVASGSCSCAATRDSYRKDLGGNPVQLYFEDLSIVAGAGRAQGAPLVSAGKPLFNYDNRKSKLVASDLLHAGQRQSVVAQPTKATSIPTRADSQPWSPSATSPFLQSLWESNAGTTNLVSPTPAYAPPQQLFNPLGTPRGFSSSSLRPPSSARADSRDRNPFGNIVTSLSF